MQHADGGDLLQKINEAKEKKIYFKESQVWRVLIETVHGLKVMHSLNVMHRDIKSANIFLCQPKPKNTTTEQNQSSLTVTGHSMRNSSGLVMDSPAGELLYQAKLGDMNVSKVTLHGMNRTQTGTPYYASPEVWRDESYSLKSDIWSLGCVIYEMLALLPPFQANDMSQLYSRVQNGTYSRIPSHYSNDIWSIVHAML